ncbi:hypothetical protein BKA81DRAFT_190374 [Phyllosticta paracitricarpa]
MKITQGIEATSPPLFFLFFPPCMNRQIPAVLCADTTKGTVRPQRTTFESTGTPTVNAGQGVPASSITSSRHPFPLIRLQKISCVASLTPATKFNYDMYRNPSLLLRRYALKTHAHSLQPAAEHVAWNQRRSTLSRPFRCRHALLERYWGAGIFEQRDDQRLVR